MKILITLPLTKDQLQRIRKSSGSTLVVATLDPKEQCNEIQDAEVVFGQMTPELMEFAPHVRWVQQKGAGVDGTLFPALVESDVVLTSEKGSVGTHLADHAMALLLSVTRGIARSVREQTWDNRMDIRTTSWELCGMTMGIVGLGGTGSAIAQRALGFGMHVLAVDLEKVTLPRGVDACWPMSEFHRLLGESDAVVVCAPLTPETNGMFDRKAFCSMRRHAVLVNVTRGKIIDEDALLEALNGKQIAAAALDVTPQEPLPADHPFWTMPNVVITPHTAGGSPERQDRIVDLFCRNILHFKKREPLEGIVDKQKGY